VDVASHADERPFELSELDNQTRSDASRSSTFRAVIPLPVRHDAIPVVGEDWHQKTVAKTHAERLFSNRSVPFRSSTSNEYFRKIVEYIYFAPRKS
jgi:hypothetical protein